MPESLLLTLIEDVLHFEPVVHVSASKATAAALQEWSDMVGAVIETLFAAYKEKLKVLFGCMQSIFEVRMLFTTGSSHC